MGLVVNLLGTPSIERAGEPYRFRSRKSWALLAHLVLADAPMSRRRLAGLLFADADDPARALRWCLAEIRRGLGDGAALDGDPVVLRLPDDAVVDVEQVRGAAWSDAVRVPGLGTELLEGFSFAGAPAFESWLLAERRRAASVAEAVLHEAALGSMARGDSRAAVGYAVRAVAADPLDENHHALLIRLYRRTGDPEAAARQHAVCRALLREELGAEPGPAVEVALAEPTSAGGTGGVADRAAIDAVVEAGTAAVAAGAVQAGVESLRTAARLADAAGHTDARIAARLALAETLVHALRGLDEEGLAMLYEADEIAAEEDRSDALAAVRCELGYVDFLRARYDRAQRWLDDVLGLDAAPAVRAKATVYLGSVRSDRGEYDAARDLLEDGVERARTAGDPQRAAYGLSMLGRIALLEGAPDVAAVHLDASVALAERLHWLAFLPWPQALRGEVQLVRGDVGGAAAVLEQAFARACQLGDPCWEGLAGRGLALLADARGDPDRALDLLLDARARTNRLADPYVWLDAYILDALCRLGQRIAHPDVAAWLRTARELTQRTGMRDLVRRLGEVPGDTDGHRPVPYGPLAR